MKKPIVTFVVAFSKQTRAMGKNNDLIWKIPEDMKRFKELTIGRPMIMGRKTFDSIGHPLPGRENIVITQNKNWSHEDITVFHTIEEAIIYAQTKDSKEIPIVGGAQIFALTLSYVDRIYLTLIDDYKEGDVYFPVFNETHFKETSREEKKHNGLHFSFVTLEKIV